MNPKLRLLSYWMPEYLLNPLIDRITELTINCLNQLLKNNGINEEKYYQEVSMKGKISQRRQIMATAQNNRLKKLIETIGYQEASIISRKALYKVGLKLGNEARIQLNINDSLNDLTSAARILYQVLGIKFSITQKDKEIFLTIKKCALAEYYTLETCKIISAVDEGVIQGLNPNYNMNFTEWMTGDSCECQANIKHR